MKDIQYSIIYRTEIEHWWYRVRRELVLKLCRIYAIRTGLKILDIGCGTGALMMELIPFGEVEGVDASEIAVTFCRSRGLDRAKVGNITDLPYSEKTFDVVLALDVLEHIRDDGTAIAEIKRVLKPNGIAIIFSPAFMFLWGMTDEVGEHYRRYTLPELRRKLTAAGFSVLFSSYFNSFLFLPILFVRAIVRALGVSGKSENILGGTGIANRILYRIFAFEASLLPHISFPFGVSVMTVCRR